MSTEKEILIVHAWLNNQLVPAGKLLIQPGICEFRYGQSFLASGYALDPINLPLTSRVYASNQLQGPLGVLGDALPDSWGRHILKHKLKHTPSITELLLSDTSSQRMGALVFGRDTKPPAIESGHRFEWLESFSKWLNNPTTNPPEHVEFGSSAGGRQPKGTISYQGKEWLAKAPTKEEYGPKAWIEHGTMLLAKKCNIPVPETLPVTLPDNSTVLLVERFDRAGSNRIHYLSAHTICQVITDTNGITISDNRSYLVLADQLTARSSQPTQDKHDLFQRIAFNILVSNHDDHSKNHGMIRLPNGQWRLSPAFDILAGEGERRDLAMIAGPEGTRATLSNLIAACEHFSLSKKAAREKLIGMTEVLSNWKTILLDEGFSPIVINHMKWAIQDNANVPANDNILGSTRDLS